MKKVIITIVLIALISQISFAQRSKHNSNNKIVDPVEVIVDNIAFDENSYLRVLDNEGNIIAYFDRFENKSCEVNSMKVYDSDFYEVYTLVPVIASQGFEVHIRNSVGVRGYVKMTPRLNGFKVIHDSRIKYFHKPYEFNTSTNVGFGKVAVEDVLRYDGEIVLASKMSMSFSGIRQTPLLVSQAYLEENMLDAANWSLILHLFQELSLEATKYRNNGMFVATGAIRNNP
ncbi:MAG: hypothetical protein JXQ96_20785 [Cyclobacteriaceae bacterium]